MEYSYKYRFDRRTIYLSACVLALLALLGTGLYLLYEGGYLSAWFTSFVGAIIALMTLSIPQRIVITDSTVEIRCLLDITEIRRDEIASVRRVDARRMKWFLPLFGGYGFFGYYGHFFDLKTFRHVRLYASERCDLVEITDLYEERLYVSCREAELLAELLTPAGGNRALDEEEDDEAAAAAIEATRAAAAPVEASREQMIPAARTDADPAAEEADDTRPAERA